ncbi:DNA-3-methyladenine glycosylase I [Loigolactobacillus zhaoyuanensis]|uniref:DNA-3-methyladenine glycosylase I n=1 Tax=Loigolactobacillus zhaoyuanensis TaxID=2486017 RepID=A0ABW8UBK2_9LACO|nr:DNA-3-methyladenine glycosylase I [Loigolactobacillus zhaoyuanensis]
MLEQQRCPWAQPKLRAYHDQEWAVPVTTETDLFRLLALQVWQSGLSQTILLRKRPAICACFHNLDPNWLRQTDEATLLQYLDSPALIRNQRKLIAIRRNAFALQTIQQQGDSLQHLLWQQTKVTHFTTATEIPRYDETAVLVAAQLKSAGFQFMGPTNCYALLATAGVINLHLTSCWRYPLINEAQSVAKRSLVF